MNGPSHRSSSPLLMATFLTASAWVKQSCRHAIGRRPLVPGRGGGDACQVAGSQFNQWAEAAARPSALLPHCARPAGRVLEPVRGWLCGHTSFSAGTYLKRGMSGKLVTIHGDKTHKSHGYKSPFTDFTRLANHLPLSPGRLELMSAHACQRQVDAQSSKPQALLPVPHPAEAWRTSAEPMWVLPVAAASQMAGKKLIAPTFSQWSSGEVLQSSVISLGFLYRSQARPFDRKLICNQVHLNGRCFVFAHIPKALRHEVLFAPTPSGFLQRLSRGYTVLC